MGKEQAWGKKSQKTLGEWNFRNGKSELAPAWSGRLGPGREFFCFVLFLVLPFGWLFTPPPFKISVLLFFFEGLFNCAFKFFFFFLALLKVLTHVANDCILVICLTIILCKIDHFYVGFYFKPE